MKRKLHVISCPRSRQRVWFGDTGLAVPPRASLLILQTAGSFTCVLQTLQYMFRKANCPCRRIIRVDTEESCNPLHYVSTAAPYYAAFRTTAAAAIFICVVLKAVFWGACHYLTNRFQMEAPVAPSRSLQEASVGMAEAFAKPSRSLLGGFSKPSAPATSS